MRLLSHLSRRAPPSVPVTVSVMAFLLIGSFMNQPVTQNYRGLKAAVIIMGILLVVGTIALVVGMVRQAGRIADHFDDRAMQHTTLPPELAGKVIQMQVDGGRLVLLVERTQGQKIIIMDMANGMVISTLDPAPAPQ